MKICSSIVLFLYLINTTLLFAGKGGPEGKPLLPKTGGGSVQNGGAPRVVTGTPVAPGTSSSSTVRAMTAIPVAQEQGAESKGVFGSLCTRRGCRRVARGAARGAAGVAGAAVPIAVMATMPISSDDGMVSPDAYRGIFGTLFGCIAGVLAFKASGKVCKKK